jgi:O6-methylguanine-DNA--protein-cysteine methyltransferase
MKINKQEFSSGISNLFSGSIKIKTKTINSLIKRIMQNISISTSSQGIDYIRIENKSSLKNLNDENFTDIEHRARRQLYEYFRGTRKKFSLPLNYANCSEFSYKVLNETIKIPYGETRTYAWLAKKCKNLKSYRAVGQAMRRNPFFIVIP